MEQHGEQPFNEKQNDIFIKQLYFKKYGTTNNNSDVMRKVWKSLCDNNAKMFPTLKSPAECTDPKEINKVVVMLKRKWERIRDRTLKHSYQGQQLNDSMLRELHLSDYEVIEALGIKENSPEHFALYICQGIAQTKQIKEEADNQDKERKQTQNEVGAKLLNETGNDAIAASKAPTDIADEDLKNEEPVVTNLSHQHQPIDLSHQHQPTVEEKAEDKPKKSKKSDVLKHQTDMMATVLADSAKDREIVADRDKFYQDSVVSLRAEVSEKNRVISVLQKRLRKHGLDSGVLPDDTD